LMVYLGLFRYFTFWKAYNVLMSTLQKSLPNILKFMVCTIILYVGFLLMGWVVIGPYSIKFRTLSQSSEALFSLLNGDDMFATFYTISDQNMTINVFGKIYIYLFVILFIYVVLSLFIAIVLDAFDAVNENIKSEGLRVEHSPLQEFLASAQAPDFSRPETRQQYAPDSLLHLGLRHHHSATMRRHRASTAHDAEAHHASDRAHSDGEQPQ